MYGYALFLVCLAMFYICALVEPFKDFYKIYKIIWGLNHCLLSTCKIWDSVKFAQQLQQLLYFWYESYVLVDWNGRWGVEVYVYEVVLNLRR